MANPKASSPKTQEDIYAESISIVEQFAAKATQGLQRTARESRTATLAEKLKLQADGTLAYEADAGGPGAMLETIFDEMAQGAEQQTLVVKAKLNGIDILAAPGTKADDLKAQYAQECLKRNWAVPAFSKN